MFETEPYFKFLDGFVVYTFTTMFYNFISTFSVVAIFGLIYSSILTSTFRTSLIFGRFLGSHSSMFLIKLATFYPYLVGGGSCLASYFFIMSAYSSLYLNSNGYLKLIMQQKVMANNQISDGKP